MKHERLKYKIKPSKSKYRAKRTSYNGFVYASQKEARYAKELDLRIKSGEILFYLKQVPFHFNLPGKGKYVCNFLEFHANGEIAFIDVKGMRTQLYKFKKKLTEDLYPVEIEEC